MPRTFLTIVAFSLLVGLAPALAQAPSSTTPPAQTDQQAAPKSDTSAPKTETTEKPKAAPVHHRHIRHSWYHWNAWPWNWHWAWYHWRYRHHHGHHS